jgi:aminoglycoside/choline kinase family phosphotransferase
MSLELKKQIITNKWVSEAGQVNLLAGDASSRRYYRVTEKEKSYILCEDNTLIEKKETHNFLVVQKLMFENKIPVPDIVDIDFKHGLILQSDLSDLTMLGLNSISNNSKILHTYQNAIDLQLKINSITKTHVKADVFVLKFDVEKLMQEMDLTIKHFVRSYLEIIDEVFISNLRDDLLKVIKEIASLPTVTTHRDYHSRNIMISNGQLFVIDFQDARQGTVQYDLVSLVDDCYFKLGDSDKDYLKRYYFNKAIEKKLFMGNAADFYHQYDLMKIQRTLKAIGSFCYINDFKKNQRYLKYVGYSFNNIRELLLEKQDLPSLSHLVKLYYEK